MECSRDVMMFRRTHTTFVVARFAPSMCASSVLRAFCQACSTSVLSRSARTGCCGFATRGWSLDVASHRRRRSHGDEVSATWLRTRSLACTSGSLRSVESPLRASNIFPDNEVALSAPSKAGSDASMSNASTESATLTEFNEHIRTLASKNAVRKLTDAFHQCADNEGPFALVDPDPESYRIAIRSLVRSARPDLGIELYKRRMVMREHRPEVYPADPSLSSSVLRALLRGGKKRQPTSEDIPRLFEELLVDCTGDGPEFMTASRDANVILSLIGAFLDAGMGTRAVEAAKALVKLSVIAGVNSALDPSAYNNAIRLLGKKRRLDGVFRILDAMRAAEVSSNNETFEFLANAAVRQVEFVTGAVSMETLPSPLGAEIAFVGRSNVGKSSLVNMICNRKALAYVSGRPGKTQQFNYFLINGGDKKSAFYLVDLPGYGYAKVPRDVQAVWLRFMDEYLAQRTSLSVVFHLMDGRHGPQPDDEHLMNRIANGRFGGEYVAVLTKVDKLERHEVRNSVLDRTREALNRNSCGPDTPILLTSSETRLGRDDIWRYLQKAIKL